ncbi:cytochrome c oxidase subunit 3 [Pseudoduganella flava]|uniref:Bb3-type cytochrome oxidase subunit III n=1 Tax=Pseudoduganella flava TaxID=871742 RepID=A0A562Q057_9BURK|nr:bb3-type cytochrome oxidase subunit III [Pseudoduganella flava]QGZ38708.1 bb3-type cytochrome oxidase subunit III [Pseudoduganella flava]TWI49716.1 cytochrome c oxidase subunit 3 [Pseudoduganella flava]
MMRFIICPLPRCGFQPDGYWPGDGAAPYGTRQVGLWTFMGVVCVLFALFGVAYVMRIGYDDWRVLPAAPWQLWLSTALLGTGDAVWQLAALAAMRRRRVLAHRLAVLGVALALAFIASQLGAWRALATQHAGLGSGPAAAFFYMLTGLHGVHVLGGVIAAGRVVLRFGGGDRAGVRAGERAGEGAGKRVVNRAGGGGRVDIVRISESLALCARYWHLLLALWLALFGLLFWVTPDVVQTICSTVGIPVR